MKEKLSGYFDSFSEYYQKTFVRRTIVGLIVGGFLWFCFYGITIIFDLFIEDNILLETFLKDLPFLGVIFALLVTMQIWGLLPQPTNDNQVSIENISNRENEDSTEEEINSEGMEIKGSE